MKALSTWLINYSSCYLRINANYLSVGKQLWVPSTPQRISQTVESLRISSIRITGTTRVRLDSHPKTFSTFTDSMILSEHEKITDDKRTRIAESHRFNSFAPERSDNEIKWYVDGLTYYWAVATALDRAKETIYILDWWLSQCLKS